MSKISRYITMGASVSTLLFLGGCSNRVEEAVSITESIQADQNELVSELNTITETESQLQNAFETTLNEDEELATLSDGSSEVFSNIEARRESFQTVSDRAVNLAEHQVALSEGENEELPQEELANLLDSLEQTTTSLSGYTEHYSAALENQAQFFESLGAEDASFDTMSDGIEQVSAEDETTKQYLLELDDHLSSLEETNQIFMSSLNDMMESN